MSEGTTIFISESTFGALTLTLLNIIEVLQYFQFLQEANLYHHELLASVGKGAGVQGYCAGFLAGRCVAVSADETELVKKPARCSGWQWVSVPMVTLEAHTLQRDPCRQVVVRLSREGQMDEITRTFPHVSESTPCKDSWLISI